MKLKTVTIPLRKNGYLEGTQCHTLIWECPVCGKPRGAIEKTRVIEETQSYPVDTWDNPCSHIDKYSEVTKEAKKNGLNNNKLLYTFMKMHIYSIPEGLSCSYHSLRTGISHDLYTAGYYYNGEYAYCNKDGLLMNDVTGFIYNNLLKCVDVLTGDLEGSYQVKNGFVMLPEPVSLQEFKKMGMNIVFRGR